MSEWPEALEYRPIRSWPGTLNTRRRPSPFSAPLKSTLTLLRKEIRELGASKAVMQIALEDQQFRNDGAPRASAIPSHPGIILLIETKDGPLSFPCDTFSTWQDNLRAIVLTMERLRAAGRYGVTTHNEQYAAWREIEAPRAMPSGFSTTTEAVEFLAEVAGHEFGNHGLYKTEAELVEARRRIIRQAQRNASSDHGGDDALMARVNLAQEFLRDAGLV